MRHAGLSLVLYSVVALAPLAPLPGLQKTPKRPKLAAGADTNHAGTYYSHGLRTIEQRPDEAANAFYWAMRLEPGWAQPYYARRLALLMAKPHMMVQYMTSRNRRFYESKDVLSLDSLELRALMLNPYVIRDLDREYIVAFLTAYAEQNLLRRGYRPGEIPRNELAYYIERSLQSESSSRERAYLAASERRFGEALELYGKALGQTKSSAGRAYLHSRRGHVFFLIGSDDSARVEMERALEELRKREDDEFVRVYNSKAVLEHSIGMIHERRRDVRAARDAYGRALQEDLSYYPAHVQLGLLAIAEGDTTTGLSELALAVEIEGNEPSLRYTCGAVLLHIGKVEEAAQHLRKVVELEPFYAAPHHLLARAAEAALKPGEALQHYQAFIARTHGRDADLAGARARVSALTAMAGKQ